MKLQLRRPIVFFDLETTGINLLKDRIVEISIVKITPGRETQPYTKTYRINPEMPIPAEATAIHGITDADVASEPTFRQVAHVIADLIRGCDLAGFNSNRFDIPMLDEEFGRAGVDFDFHRAQFVDVQTIFHKKEPRNLSAAYRFYCDKELEGAHGAAADTMATYEIFLAQVDHYTDLPGDVVELAKFSKQNENIDIAGRFIVDAQGREVINFGKYKGQPISEVLARDPGYYDWIQRGEFANDTKRTLMRLKLKYSAR